VCDDRAWCRRHEKGRPLNEIRVATWNVNAFNPARAVDKARLLRIVKWDVALLQEVNVETFRVFRDAGLHGVHALDLLPGPHGPRAHGVAILVRQPVAIRHHARIPLGVPPDAPEPLRHASRALEALLDVGGVALSVASFHAPHAAHRDPARARQLRLEKNAAYSALEDWIATIAPPLVLGMDGNVWTEPAPIDTLPPEVKGCQESLFHASDARHGLRDALVEHLTRNRPELLARRLQLGLNRLDGALAVTYQRSSNNHPRVNRMDRIHVSPGFTVHDVETLYEDALTVGSDHAMVVARLS
jgi:exonuclease III